MKKIAFVAILLALLLTFASCGKVVFERLPAAEGNASEESTSSGSLVTDSGDISWKLNGEGVLEISGTGSVVALPVDKTAVKEIVIGDGFDTIGEGAFDGMSETVSVTIPDSVKKICSDAFKDCIKLESLEIPESVEDIDESAFEGWEEAQRIIADWYEGSVEYWKEWFDFDCEFGEYFDGIQRGEEIPEEIERKLSAWWEQWKDSDYWKECPVIREDIEKAADSFFGYWSEFGDYILSEDGTVEPKEPWWEEYRNFLGFLEEKSGEVKFEVPQEFFDIYGIDPDEIDEAVRSFQGSYSFDAEELKENAERFRSLWEEYFGREH